MKGITFADKARGIYGSNDGSLFLTDPGTFHVKCSPFFFPAPYRVLCDEKFDPYFIVISKIGRIFVVDSNTSTCVINTQLPPFTAKILSIDLQSDGKVIILNMDSSQFLYDGEWRLISVPEKEEKLSNDEHFSQEISRLETQLASASYAYDIDTFKVMLKRYFYYCAAYVTHDQFIALWSQMITTAYQFEQPIKEIFQDILQSIKVIDRISPYCDELQILLDTMTSKETEV